MSVRIRPGSPKSEAVAKMVNASAFQADFRTGFAGSNPASFTNFLASLQKGILEM